MPSREQILAQVNELPMLPVTVGRVMHLLQNQDVGIAEVMDAIEVDPGLTANVLKLANSAYFAGPARIATLRDAGVFLGAQRLFHLVLATVVSPMARVPIQAYDLPPGRLLDHLIAVAIGTEEIARLTTSRAPAHAFTAGLLHDIGKVVLGTVADLDIAPVIQCALEEDVPFEEAERRILGTDHAELGAELLQRWQLPDELVSVVRWHHSPEEAPIPSPVLDLVHVAVALSMQCGIGAGADGLQYRLSAGSIDRLGVTQAGLDIAASNILIGIEELRPLFTTPADGGPETK